MENQPIEGVSTKNCDFSIAIKKNTDQKLSIWKKLNKTGKEEKDIEKPITLLTMPLFRSFEGTMARIPKLI